MSRSVRKRKRVESTRDDQESVQDLTLWVQYKFKDDTFEVTHVAKDVDLDEILENGLPSWMLRDIINDDQGWKSYNDKNYSIRVARRTPHPLISRLSSASVRRENDFGGDSVAYVKVNGAIQVSPLKPDALTNVEYLTDGSPMVHLKLLILSQDKPKQPRSDRSHKSRKFGIILVTHTWKEVNLEVKASDTIEDLKKMVREKEGTPVEQQRLIYAGEELEDGRTVGHYRVRPDSRIFTVLRLRGS